jgi:hypothetical protein
MFHYNQTFPLIMEFFKFIFSFFFGEDKHQSQLTSTWHPQVKLSGRGPAGLSLADQWV